MFDALTHIMGLMGATVFFVIVAMFVFVLWMVTSARELRKSYLFHLKLHDMYLVGVFRVLHFDVVVGFVVPVVGRAAKGL